MNKETLSARGDVVAPTVLVAKDDAPASSDLAKDVESSDEEFRKQCVLEVAMVIVACYVLYKLATSDPD